MIEHNTPYPLIKGEFRGKFSLIKDYYLDFFLEEVEDFELLLLLGDLSA